MLLRNELLPAAAHVLVIEVVFVLGHSQHYHPRAERTQRKAEEILEMRTEGRTEVRTNFLKCGPKCGQIFSNADRSADRREK